MIPIFIGTKSEVVLRCKNGTDTEFNILSVLCIFSIIIQNQNGLVIELVLVTVVSSKEQKLYALVSIEIQDSTHPCSRTKIQALLFSGCPYIKGP